MLSKQNNSLILFFHVSHLIRVISLLVIMVDSFQPCWASVGWKYSIHILKFNIILSESRYFFLKVLNLLVLLFTFLNYTYSTKNVFLLFSGKIPSYINKYNKIPGKIHDRTNIHSETVPKCSFFCDSATELRNSRNEF